MIYSNSLLWYHFLLAATLIGHLTQTTGGLSCLVSKDIHTTKKEYMHWNKLAMIEQILGSNKVTFFKCAFSICNSVLIEDWPGHLCGGGISRSVTTARSDMVRRTTLSFAVKVTRRVGSLNYTARFMAFGFKPVKRVGCAALYLYQNFNLDGTILNQTET